MLRELSILAIFITANIVTWQKRLVSFLAKQYASKYILNILTKIHFVQYTTFQQSKHKWYVLGCEMTSVCCQLRLPIAICRKHLSMAIITCCSEPSEHIHEAAYNLLAPFLAELQASFRALESHPYNTFASYDHYGSDCSLASFSQNIPCFPFLWIKKRRQR